jgi:iron complex outermembrane receptor protein
LTNISAAGVVIPGVTLNNRAPFAPKWKASIGAQYEVETGAGTITPRIDYAYQSAFFTNIDNNPLGEVPGYGTFNAHVSWASADENWRLTAEVKNLANKLYYYNLFYNLGERTAQPAPPREWSMTLKRKF